MSAGVLYPALAFTATLCAMHLHYMPVCAFAVAMDPRHPWPITLTPILPWACPRPYSTTTALSFAHPQHINYTQ